MRQLIGKRLVDIDVGQIAAIARAFSRTLIDVGTGDGRYPLLVARARPDTVIVAIDPATDAMTHAGRRIVRGRVPNVVLLVGAVESVAPELAGIAHEVRVHFPWGSLLRGVLGQDADVLDALARLPRLGGSLTVLLSLVPGDGFGPFGPERIDGLAVAYGALGLGLVETRPLTRDDVRQAGSSWGKRLDAGGKRPGVYMRFLRDAARGRAQKLT